MSVDLDNNKPFTAEPIPGDFLRHAKTGAPYVTDPTGATTKGTKANPGTTKTVMYGRMSGAGSQIENTYNLQKWAERRTVYGLALQHGDSPAISRAFAELAALELDSDAYKEAADRLVVQAKGAAKASLAADRGTHVHALTEDDDAGSSWLTRAETGEDLGIGIEVQAALVSGWRRLLDDYGLEVLAREAKVVHDGWRLAGTLDRIVRLTRDLTFEFDGLARTWPAGTAIVLDIKSGRLSFARNGSIAWWHKYAPQVAAYAGGVPYDPATGERSAWPFVVDQDFALIAHLPLLSLIDTGEAVLSLIPVDLAAGRYAAELCVQAKEWEKRSDLFGTAVPAVPINITQPAPIVAIIEPPARRAGLIARAATLKTVHPEAVKWVKARWPDNVPKLSGDHLLTDTDMDAIDNVLRDAEAEFVMPFTDHDITRATVNNQPTHDTPQKPVWVRPDDGQMYDDTQDAAVKNSVQNLLPPDRARVVTWLNEAVTAGRPIKPGAHHTDRSIEIVRAMANCAFAFGEDPGFLRVMLDATTGTDAGTTTASIGSLFGSLTTIEAAQLANTIYMHSDDLSGAITINPDGAYVLTGNQPNNNKGAQST